MALRGFEEVAAVGRALGIALPTDISQQGLALHQSFPKTMYASMYHDLAKGRPMEFDSLSGYVVRQGRALGVPTPIHEMAYLALKPYLDGTPKPLLAQLWRLRNSCSGPSAEVREIRLSGV